MAEEEDFSSLPLTDRFSHKVNPGLWKGAVADSNVAAQQEGLGSYCAFLKFGGVQACVRTRATTVYPICEKGLPSTRPAAKANAIEALLLCVELDKSDPVIEEIIPALSHKVPKVIAAALAGLKAIYHNFGCKIVDPKPVLKALPKVFGHADKNVRAEAQNLTVELYRWLKEAIKPLFWNDLKPVQQQDLEKLFENVKQEPAPKQERFTRAQQDAMAAASAAPDGGEDEFEGGEEYPEEEDEGEVDAFDLAEPVDVFSKIPDNFQEQLSSSKWKDRKEALDALHTVLNVPKIKDGPFDDVVRMLAKSMKDANIAVVTVAANCIELLAKGVRSGFVKYRATVMSPMLERLKEKKQSVADALGQALDAVFIATSLSECLEEILEFLKHKNPQVKQETLKFLIRCLRTTRDVPAKPEVKSIAEAGTKLLTESTEVNRAGGAEVLGTLMKIMGERAMNPYLDGLDDIRKTKIKEFFETAEVKAKDRPKPIVAPPKPAPGKKVVAKKPALGAKKPTAAAAPPVEEPVAAPSPKPARSVPSKLGGPAKPGGLPAPGGLKKRLGGPGGLASPQRRVISPPTEEQPPAPAPPKFGLGRGLAGRPITKPAAPSEPAPAPAAPQFSGISALERAELDELRAEKERFMRMVEDLRSERTKLNSQVMELQDQNAQLIEDHTRDVLSIKAKETQLVRARSDAEAAEQTVQKQQREIERLKRELARALRASAISPPNTLPENIGLPMSESGSVYQEDGRAPITRAGLHMGSRFESSRPRSYASASPSEEKENNGLESSGLSSREGGLGRRKLSPSLGTGYSGLGSPTRSSGLGSGSASGEEQPARSAEPAESWKRAAEVTSQLKARIEQMKVRNNNLFPRVVLGRTLADF
ncbi:microtubule-associated protein, microtubule dynamics during spindle orientation [Aspergillus brasiliensis]|nr:microtubule-associated protein, microtubule dynamics during spindle orientation [Aspergillus brasiliensis]